MHQGLFEPPEEEAWFLALGRAFLPKTPQWNILQVAIHSIQMSKGSRLSNMKPGLDLSNICFQGKAITPGGRKPAAAPTRADVIRAAPSAETESLDDFVHWAFARAGLDASPYRSQVLRRRLPACLRELKARSTEEARLCLTRRPDLLPVVIDAFVLGVTEFFRDAIVFEGLRNGVLPILTQRNRPLRIWSAGCSTGEELYSMAILLAEAGVLEYCDLLGTDCREDAVQRSQTGLYDGTALQHLDATIRGQYFEAIGEKWRPKELLRHYTRWKQADIFRGIEEGPWDVILWRNVAIYLNPAPTTMILERLFDSLAHDGFLILGKAERPSAGLRLLPRSRCIYQRRSE